MCVCDLMAGLDLPQSTVSRHMSFLKNSDWVTSRRKGKWVYYSLNTPSEEIQSLVLHVLRQNLPDYPAAKQDYARLMHHLQTKDTESCTS